MAAKIPYDRILVATDGSTSATAAIDHTAGIAEAADASVDLVHVVDRRIIVAADDEMREELRDSLRETGETLLAAGREQLGSISLHSHLLSGTPSKEILSFATEHDVDLIVIGRSGKSPREKLMGMGSVSERVVDGAPLPVLVVRAD